MDENIKNATIKPKKKRLTKVVFYIMSIMLLSTTCMCGFMTYTLYNMSYKATTVNTEEATSNNYEEPETSTEVNNDALVDLENEAIAKGKAEILSAIKADLENGTSTLRIIRSIFPEHLVYGDSGKYVFKDINTNLLMNNYKKENFVIKTDDNKIPTSVEYYENNTLVSYTGIDVSKHNGTIDWAKVANSNIDFAILRAVVRGYGTEGKLLTDESFERNVKGAIENNIAVGAYVFSEAITVEEAIEEAELVLSTIKPYDIKGPVVIDIEDIENDTGRNENLSPTELTDIVLAFCEKIKSEGYTPMIYCNIKGFLGMLEFERLEGIEKWYAYYGDELYFPYDLSIWQYTANGTVEGIKGSVDLNISFKEYK